MNFQAVSNCYAAVAVSVVSDHPISNNTASSTANRAHIAIVNEGNHSAKVMPVNINGGQLAQKVRALRPTTKVLLTSGYVKNSAISEAIASGDVMVLLKPYRPADLAQQIRAIIEAH